MGQYRKQIAFSSYSSDYVKSQAIWRIGYIELNLKGASIILSYPKLYVGLSNMCFFSQRSKILRYSRACFVRAAHILKNLHLLRMGILHNYWWYKANTNFIGIISLSSSQCKKHSKASVAIKLNTKVTWSFSSLAGIRKRCAVFSSATDK
jgi:hypothetical protein